jgi:ATP-binding cassette subfamily F protein 3
VIFELEDARIDVGDPPLTLLEHVHMWLERGEHVTLVGPNGAGKTTLIEALAGQRPLSAGRLRTGHNVQIGYLSQHTDELGSTGTVLEAAQRATGMTPNRARALLGRFLFGGELAEKPLAGLSGGERRRLSLAILTGSSANVLILDEPTNHLDVESREALEDALQAFPGSLLLVSHDRALLDAVGTRTVAVEGGTLHSHLGGWAEYVRVREERKAAGEEPPSRARPRAAAEPARAAKAERPKPAPGPSKNRLRDQSRAERAVEAAESALAALEQELSDPSAWSTKYESAKNEARHTAAKRAVDTAYSELETLLEP